MSSSYFSRLSGTFRRGVEKTIGSQEAGLLDAVERLFSLGKYFLGHSRLFSSGTFGSFNDLHALLGPGKLAAAQSNLYLVNRRKNYLVAGAISHTFSTPVSGPSIQGFGYHIDLLLADFRDFSSGINTQRAPMAVSYTRAFPADCTLSILTHRGHHPQMSAPNPCISVNYGCHDGCGKAHMSLRDKEQPNNFLIYGYFAYNIAKRRGSSNPYPAFGWKDFQTLSPASSSTGTAPDTSFDNSAYEEQLANSADSSNQQMITGRTLKLQSASCYLPHPDKEETGGEDAHFICAYEQAIGVADGVGGWADLGIDAGLYARELMSNSVTAVQEEPKGYIDPARVLEKAYLSTKAKGSSTACIIALTDQGLHAINLGDSGFMVVRDGCTVFRSPVQQHDFNFTYQLEGGNGGDLPSSGQVFAIPVAPGDVIVAGTDGLFDNLYNNDITTVVVHAMRSGLGPQVTAQKIAALARQLAQDKSRQTPFSAAAQGAGFRYYGGKLDDITVVVSYITVESNEKISECASG